MANNVIFKTLNNEKQTEVWQYRGEGNANVALSLPEIKKIIRIRKKIKTYSKLLQKSINEGRNINFYENVIVKLLNPFVGDIKLIEIEPNEIDKLNSEIFKYRPVHRYSKELDYNGSSLMDDYCLLPNSLESYITEDTFSVEIKPKQGFINEFSEIKCFYCQNQYMKLAQGKINSVSAYCPLNLFSGNEEKIKHSIKHLIENPQNNFRLFKNGNLIYDENCDGVELVNATKKLFSIENMNDDFSTFLYQALTRNFSMTSSNIFCSDCCFSKKTNILQSIMSVQQMDKHQNLTAYNLNYDDWNYVNIVIDDVIQKRNCILCALRSYLTESNTEKYMIPYLISAVAKDCSIMITFGKANERIKNLTPDIADNLIHLQNGSFVFKINVMDVFPKPFTTVQKHISRDIELLKYNDNVIYK